MRVERNKRSSSASCGQLSQGKSVSLSLVSHHCFNSGHLRGVCVPRSIGRSSCRDTYTQVLRNINQFVPAEDRAGGGPGRRRTGPAEDRAGRGPGRRRTGPADSEERLSQTWGVRARARHGLESRRSESQGTCPGTRMEDSVLERGLASRVRMAGMARMGPGRLGTDGPARPVTLNGGM